MPPPKNKQTKTKNTHTHKKPKPPTIHTLKKTKQKKTSPQMKQSKMPRLEWNNHIFSVLKVMHVQRQL